MMRYLVQITERKGTMVLSGRLSLLWARSSGDCWLLAGCMPGGALQALLNQGKTKNNSACILKYI